MKTRALYLALLATTISGCAVKEPINKIPENSNLLDIKVYSEPSNKEVSVFIDAVDQFGGQGINLETGLPYPWDGRKVTPWVHTIAYNQNTVLSIRVEAIMSGDPGDTLVIELIDKGIKVTDPSSLQVIPDNAGSTLVVRKYTTIV